MILDPRHYRLDDLLRRPYTKDTPFGSSGDCVWATSPQGWGFSNGVQYIHAGKEIAPFAFRIFADEAEILWQDALYRPSHVSLHALDAPSGLQITEDKFITQNDVVVSVLHLRNAGEFSVDLDIRRTWGIQDGEHELRKNVLVWVKRIGPPPDDLRQSLGPGARATIVFAVAFAPTEAEAEKRALFWTNHNDPVRAQSAAYQAWFDKNVPLFECSDPWLTKLWLHRWYLVKKNHSNPRAGLTKQDTFSEGRWKSEWYSASITYGAGHVLRELRWLRDPKYARNYFQGFADNQRHDGLFRSWYVDGIARPNADEGKYTDWITAALWDAHLVKPLPQHVLRNVAPVLARNVAYWQTHEQTGRGLLTVDSHWWTGMEWQPSFFTKADYQLGDDKSGNDMQNPVERLDLTAYQFANARALSQVWRELENDEAAEEAERIAEHIKAGVLKWQWDEESGLFYDVLPETGERIVSAPTIAAFYPFYAGLPNQEQARAWAHLLNPSEFWTPFPPASTSQTSPAYSQDKTMRGKPLTLCAWNGPTWPHANSLVISGLAQSLRQFGESAHPGGTRTSLFALVNSFGRAQFEDNDFARPHTGEYYSGETGQWLTGERDYLHSTWADLILTALLGIVPRNDDVLEIHPLLPSIENGGWAYFCVQDVIYRNRLLTLVWDDPAHPEDAFNDGDKGFTIYVSGKRLHHQSDLAPLTVDLPDVED